MKDGTENIENYKNLLEKFKELFNDLKNKLVEHLTKIKNIYTNMENNVIELDDIIINNNIIEFKRHNKSVDNNAIKNFIIILDNKIDLINKISNNVKQNINNEKENTKNKEKELTNNFLDLVKN
jgi:hypothetical protein